MNARHSPEWSARLGGVLVACALSCAPASDATLAATPATIAPRTVLTPRVATRSEARPPTFLHRPPAVGDRTRVRTETASRTLRDDGVPEGERYHSDYELVVRAASGSAVTEAVVIFYANERDAWDGQDDDLRYAPKATPLAGKRLRMRAEPLSVEEETGGPVSAEISHLALAAVSDLGMRGAMESALPDREIAVGDRVDALAPALVRALNPRTWHLESGGATLRTLTDGDGTFEASFVVKTESGRTLSLAGDVEIARRDRTILAITLAGSYQEPDGRKGELLYKRTATLTAERIGDATRGASAAHASSE